MNTLSAAGEAMLLAHEGQRHIAAALAAEAHRLMRRLLARLGQLLPNARSK